VLTQATDRTLGQFIFKEILCHWGELEEIVTDNSTAFVAVLDWIAECYHIWHIKIFAYNSQASGVVETTHWTIRDNLVKMCHRNIKKWYKHALYVFWADCVTTHKSTGMTPFYVAYGIKPLLLFDITKVTFFIARISKHQSIVDFLVVYARMLQK